jgi:AraC-like DNA-binding protein
LYSNGELHSCKKWQTSTDDGGAMGLVFEERTSDLPFIQTITHGVMTGNATTIRPAENNWHMVFTKVNGTMRPLVVGPLLTSGVVKFIEGVEVLWIRFTLGTFMPHLPAKNFVNTETILPEASSSTFWLHGSSWQFPHFENAETFVDRLVRSSILVRDPVVNAVLEDEDPNVAERTVRHRFQHATGLTQNHIWQVNRAQKAVTMLRQGVSILDTVYDLGYFDQPHLTKALKRYIGTTPSQEVVKFCQSVRHAGAVDESHALANERTHR